MRKRKRPPNRKRSGPKIARRRNGKPNGGPHPVDIYVGGRVRLRRTLLGLSQEKLGEAVGLTFQQIQKYERGSNRIGASRLFEFSEILNVPVSYFFEGAAGDTPSSSRTASNRGKNGPDGDLLKKRETLELIRAYYSIQSPQTRKKICELIKDLAKNNGA